MHLDKNVSTHSVHQFVFIMILKLNRRKFSVQGVFPYMTDKHWPDALVSIYYNFKSLLLMPSFFYLPSSTVKFPQHAAYGVTLVERRT
jgi:hypothetical protein